MATTKVFDTKGNAAGEIAVPTVFSAPIRKDIIQFVWMNMKRNKSQAYGVFRYAGVQVSAHSWGPGRAVARVPRAHGGIGAYASMCRGGHMYAPTTVYRRWHRKTLKQIKRYAVASAVAATQLNSLVEAHGHRTQEIPAIPLVVDMQNVEKTKDAVAILKNIKAYNDVEAVVASRTKRAGKGAYRNRRYVQKCGPMVVYAPGDNVDRGFRNIPGITLENVEALNLLNLAPGGHPGRFVIWTKKAFESLNDVYAKKAHFHMPAPMVKQTDFEKFFKSEAMVRAYREKKPQRVTESKNNMCCKRFNNCKCE